MGRVPHRLFGTRDAARPCSAAEWAAEARAQIAAAHADGRLPILVGGTGLYLRTLLDGIAPVPPIDPDIRAVVRARGVAENLSLLQLRDPQGAAALRPTDSTRIARALEVVLSTGQPLAHWHARKVGGIGGDVRLAALILLPPRPWLYERCDRRFAEMLQRGAVAEVERLLARRLDPQLPAMRAIGVREVAALLSGEIGREEAVAAGAKTTRNYAKRQYTWFAHQPPPDWVRFTRPLDQSGAVEEALALLARAG